MATFKDNQGKQWTIDLDGPTILRVRSATCDIPGCTHLQSRKCEGIDLADVSGDVYRELASDPVMLVNALWLICKPQADSDGISDQQFGGRIVGDIFDSATAAIRRAYADFSPAWKKEILDAVANKDETIRRKSIEMAIKKINDPALEANYLAAKEAELDEEIKKLLIRSSSATSSPASSASAPTAEPSAS